MNKFLREKREIRSSWKGISQRRSSELVNHVCSGGLTHLGVEGFGPAGKRVCSVHTLSFTAVRRLGKQPVK
ncbi:hypothetical protein Hanom_Chr01g00084581 [Helianthus anomalus]